MGPKTEKSNGIKYLSEKILYYFIVWNEHNLHLHFNENIKVYLWRDYSEGCNVENELRKRENKKIRDNRRITVKELPPQTVLTSPLYAGLHILVWQAVNTVNM